MRIYTVGSLHYLDIQVLLGLLLAMPFMRSGRCPHGYGVVLASLGNRVHKYVLAERPLKWEG